MENLHQKLVSHKLKLVFNMMKWGCSLKCCLEQLICLPEGLCHHPGDKGNEEQGSFDCAICSNANRSLKVQLAIIKDSKNPRCFHMEKPPLYYMFQNKVYGDKHTLQKCFFSILTFCEGACALIQKGALFIGNFAAHDKDVLTHDRVDIHCLPPITQLSINQLMQK